MASSLGKGPGDRVRGPAVAGSFYPGDPEGLREMVEGLLASASGEGAERAPKALIAPHAGFVYSGPVAASIYARLRRFRDLYSRVVLLGPAHRYLFHGIAAPSARAFRTPLGEVPLNRELLARALELPSVRLLDEAHEGEHSLEVHLPFLQTVLDEFALAPLVVGDAGMEEVASVLRALWGGEETLVVISSDLSHFLSYEEANARDESTAEAIEALDPDGIGRDQACGRIPVGGLLLRAREEGLRVERVDLRNSGDTAGPRDQVVGYGSFLFTGR
ncbi:MAG: AmmeMemoRadiSam system protein B [Gemmatimonadota bacterium]